METLLSIERIGFPSLSARGCDQTLEPIPQGELRRSVNGDLHFLGNVAALKYRSTIRCADQNSFSLNNEWVGSCVKVGCIQPLWFQGKTEPNGKITLPKAVRPGLFKTCSAEGKFLNSYLVGPATLNCEEEPGKLVEVCYYPLLTMYIKHFTFQSAEWEIDRNSWTLDLEEA
jgi:hypothetical protein